VPVQRITLRILVRSLWIGLWIFYKVKGHYHKNGRHSIKAIKEACISES
jgi:hypothetical protein